MDLDDADSGIQARPLNPPLANTSSPRDGEPSVSEQDKIRKWQEERLDRRLRGEYESAVLQLNELLAGNLTTPLRLSAIRVQGTPNTRSSFLSSIVSPVLDQSTDKSTLQSVLHQVRTVGDSLARTDIFSSVEPTLERSHNPFAKDEDVEVVFKVKEKSRFFLKSATEIGNGEGTASLTGRGRNVFGGAETLEGSVSMGMKTRRAFHVTLNAPLTGSLRTHGEVTAFGTERDNTSFLSSREVLRGLKACIRTPSALGSHEFAYEATLRHVTSLEPSASIAIRKEAGKSVKSSLSHTFIHDTRDDPHTSSRGFFFKAFQEVAGVGGDAAFVKSETESHVSRWLTPGLALSFTTRTGMMLPLNLETGRRPIYLSDRFHLGGPLTVRMFRANSLGPRVETDSLGGDLYWAAGLSLIGKIPRKHHWPLRTHLFVNAGHLQEMERTKPLLNSIKDSLSQPSVSAGMGLIYRFDTARLELNFGVPLVVHKTDGVQRGFQAGLGLEFL